MKKLKWSFLTAFISFFCLSSVFAAGNNAVYLEKENIDVHGSFLRSFVDYYQNDSEKNNSSLLYIFSKDGYKPQKFNRIESLKIGMFYGGEYQLSHYTNGGNTSSKYSIPLAEPYFIMKLNENKDVFTFRYNFGKPVPENYNKFTSRITQFSYVHNFNENQALSCGQDVRVPIGVDGSISTWDLDTVLRAQIARTYANTYGIGVRNLGKYKFLDYDIGLYDSSRALHNFFNGGEFIGLFTFKPFANMDNEKYGSLKIGTSIDYGHNKFDYGVYGMHFAYDIGKFHSKFEYAYADGYNSIKPVNKNSEGFYTSVSYDLTKKFSIVGKYDYINNDKKMSCSDSKEYTVGVVYSPKERFKFLFNYMYRNADCAKNSNNILISTRILI